MKRTALLQQNQNGDKKTRQDDLETLEESWLYRRNKTKPNFMHAAICKSLASHIFDTYGETTTAIQLNQWIDNFQLANLVRMQLENQILKMPIFLEISYFESHFSSSMGSQIDFLRHHLAFQFVRLTVTWLAAQALKL
ncbi:MAG: hypothetical protein GY820_28600, partial [Gammaproteobacteria bacterium]|nr:hypothetical protein [Gammaproteobacteria bacterium]